MKADYARGLQDAHEWLIDFRRRKNATRQGGEPIWPEPASALTDTPGLALTAEEQTRADHPIAPEDLEAISDRILERLRRVIVSEREKNLFETGASYVIKWFLDAAISFKEPSGE